MEIEDAKAYLFMTGAPLYFFKEFPKNELSGTQRFGHMLTTDNLLALAVQLLAIQKVMKTHDGSSILSHQYVIHWDGKK